MITIKLFYVFSEGDLNDRKRSGFVKNLLPYFYKFLVGEYVYYLIVFTHLYLNHAKTVTFP